MTEEDKKITVEVSIEQALSALTDFALSKLLGEKFSHHHKEALMQDCRFIVRALASRSEPDPELEQNTEQDRRILCNEDRCKHNKKVLLDSDTKVKKVCDSTLVVIDRRYNRWPVCRSFLNRPL